MAVAAMLLLAAGLLLGEPLVSYYHDVWFIFASGFLAVLAKKTAGLFGGDARTVWHLAALGFAGWFFGDLAWAVYEIFLNTPMPYPSLADIAYVLGNILIAAGVLLEAQRLPGEHTKKALMASAAGLLFLGFFAKTYLLEIAADTELGALEKFVNLFYPVTDTLMFATAVYIMLVYGGVFRKMWQLFAAGAIVTALADSLFSYMAWVEIYEANYFLMDVIWAVGYVLLGMAMWEMVEMSKAPVAAKSRKRTG